MVSISNDHSERHSSLCPYLKNYEIFIRDSPWQALLNWQKSQINGHRRESYDFFRKNFLYFVCKMSETLRIFNSTTKSLRDKSTTTRISAGIGLFKNKKI